MAKVFLQLPSNTISCFSLAYKYNFKQSGDWWPCHLGDITLYGSRNYPYPPHAKSLLILRGCGRGVGWRSVLLQARHCERLFTFPSKHFQTGFTSNLERSFFNPVLNAFLYFQLFQVKLKGLENFSQAVLEFFKSAITRSVPDVTQGLSTEEIGKSDYSI